MGIFRHSPATLWLLRGVTVALYVFIFAPIVVVIYASFSPFEVVRFPFSAFSLRWYAQFVASATLQAAIRNSAVLGVAASIGTALLSGLAALAVVRFSFRFKGVLGALVMSPMVISKVVLGAAILSFLASASISRSWVTLILTHVLLTMPYAFMVIWARLATFGRDYEEAALVLGADEISAGWEVTLPQMAPAIMGALFLAFTVSFDEFGATQFLVTPQTTTVPVQVFSMIETAITPTINVLATFLILVTGVFPAIAALGFGAVRFGRYRRPENGVRG